MKLEAYFNLLLHVCLWLCTMEWLRLIGAELIDSCLINPYRNGQYEWIYSVLTGSRCNLKYKVTYLQVSELWLDQHNLWVAWRVPAIFPPICGCFSPAGVTMALTCNGWLFKNRVVVVRSWHCKIMVWL